MKYLVNRLLALLLQLKVKVTSKGQGQLVAKGKVTKKDVCLSNSIQHLVTGCWSIQHLAPEVVCIKTKLMSLEVLKKGVKLGELTAYDIDFFFKSQSLLVRNY